MNTEGAVDATPDGNPETADTVPEGEDAAEDGEATPGANGAADDGTSDAATAAATATAEAGPGTKDEEAAGDAPVDAQGTPGGAAPDAKSLSAGSASDTEVVSAGSASGAARVSGDTASATEQAADGTAPDAGGATASSSPDTSGTGGSWRDRYPAVARTAGLVATGAATVLVLCAFLLPNSLPYLKPSTFVRLPVEAILAAAALLALRSRARRTVAVLLGLVLGLLTLVKLIDMGFYSILDRPFDLMLDWPLLGDAESAFRDSAGQTAATGAVIGILVLALGLPVLMVFSVLRLTRLMARHRVAATRTTLILGTVWMTCAALGVQVIGSPVASRNVAALVEDRVGQVRADIKDNAAFAKAAAHDDFARTPSDQLLTGLRGKDVIFAFIESYGRGAVEDPGMAPGVDAVLAKDTERLRAAGYSTRSAWLTSPTFGGGSWLAHSTFMSGLWIKDQQRYRTVTSSSRMSLTDAFKRTGAWRTVGIMPGVRRSWPEAKFYGLDHVYDSHHLGYQGPNFSWSRMPDQYTLSAFQRLEHGKRHDKPLMTEVILTSSHEPWAPLPKTLGWDQVGDGSVYKGIAKAGKDPKQVWKDASQVRTEYGRSIQYSVNSLVSYVEKYGNKNTVLVFLGDHQPAPIVSGVHASRDVPVAIVAHDPAVLDRMSGWKWQSGLKPGPQAPVWRMDTFRDRFLTTYGPQAGSSPSKRSSG
ncbi:sulfatase [Streptomyces sp. NPDC002004]